jgi:hypothetical protein
MSSFLQRLYPQSAYQKQKAMGGFSQVPEIIKGIEFVNVCQDGIGAVVS